MYQSVCNIVDCVCIIFCYNVICVNNNVCGSSCVQHQNNTYVWLTKMGHGIYNFTILDKNCANFKCPDKLDFIYSHAKKKIYLNKKTLASKNTLHIV